MQISSLMNNTTNFRESDWSSALKPTRNVMFLSEAGNIGCDKFHPIDVFVKFHDNGKISSVDITYENGKFASGDIHEDYDENGKNINYKA